MKMRVAFPARVLIPETLSAASCLSHSFSSPAASSSKKVSQPAASQKYTVPSFIDKITSKNQEKKLIKFLQEQYILLDQHCQ